MNKSFFPIVLIIIICIYFLSVYSSKNELVFDKNIIRIQIVDSIKTLGIYNQITTQYINGSKVKNKSWLKRNWIMENATIAELTKLTDHSNSVVKSIAYEGLLRKTEVDKFLLLEKVLKDTTSILWVQSGCVSNEIFLGEHLMENVLSLSEITPPLPPEKTVKIQLSQHEKSRLNVLYENLFNKRNLYLKNK